MREENRKLIHKLENRELIFGTHIFCGTPILTEAIAQCGFDVLWIDMEHTAIDIASVTANLIAARSGGTPAWVRVPWNDPVRVKPVVDMGADGIIFPYVRTAEEARLAAASCSYPPEGVRGYGPLRALDYGAITQDEFLKLESCRVKNLKIQKKTYCSEEKELTKKAYLSLLKAAQKDKRLHLIMETICSTGIRVSELQYFTMEAVRDGEIHIRLKGKARVILIPGKLRHKLLTYCKQRNIMSGIIFRNGNGESLNRSSIWAMMKKLCTEAGVAASKVFPHNLRKLFARCFYETEKDIAKLSDILGHSSIDTTRIYIMTTGREHLLQIERLGLVV